MSGCVCPGNCSYRRARGQAANAPADNTSADGETSNGNGDKPRQYSDVDHDSSFGTDDTSDVVSEVRSHDSSGSVRQRKGKRWQRVPGDTPSKPLSALYPLQQEHHSYVAGRLERIPTPRVNQEL